MNTKLATLAFLLTAFAINISAMKGTNSNQQVSDAIKAGDIENVTTLLARSTDIDICEQIRVAHENKQLDILKLLADWCCCRSKAVPGFISPRVGAAVLAYAQAAATTAQRYSGFLPPSDGAVLVFSIKADGSLQPNSSFNGGSGAVLQALNNDSINEVSQLLGGGGFPANSVLQIQSALGTRLESLMQYAVKLKNPALITALVNAGADINYGGGSGVGTALHTAVANLDLDMVNDLIRRGANVNATDASGVTPLHTIASRAGSPGAAAIAQALIDAGADNNVQDNEGRSPIVQITGANTMAVAQIIEGSLTQEAAEQPAEENLFREENVSQAPGGELQIYMTPQRPRYQPGQQYVAPQPLMNIIP